MFILAATAHLYRAIRRPGHALEAGTTHRLPYPPPACIAAPLDPAAIGASQGTRYQLLRALRAMATGEAMVVDPVSGDLVFVTKEWSRLGTSGVYRSPAGLAAGSTTTLERVGEVPLEPGTLVTGADVTRDGSLVALRSYGAVDLYRRPAGEPLWAAFSTTPCSGPSPGELQGESIAFAPDGGSYMTVAEGPDPVLHLTVP